MTLWGAFSQETEECANIIRSYKSVIEYQTKVFGSLYCVFIEMSTLISKTSVSILIIMRLNL